MSSDVDKLFEDIFGYKGGSPAPKPKAKSDPGLLAIADEVEPDPVHEDPSDSPGTVEDAARAVRDAVLAHTGRRRPVKAWKSVAGKVLHISRLYTKRWQEVLDKGIELGLLKIDTDSLSYPVLIGIPEPEPEPVDEEWEALKADQERRAALLASRNKVRPPPPATPPEDWKPATYLDCGHWNYQTHLKSEEDYTDSEKARLAKARKDKAEYGMVKPRFTVLIETPADCPACKAGKPPDSYQHQKGKHKTPVPERQRRTEEREQGLGWPGLCTDPKTGLYIGGIANNCRHANPKGPWCVVHGGKGSKGKRKA
jgi:hypothetical protein